MKGKGRNLLILLGVLSVFAAGCAGGNKWSCSTENTNYDIFAAVSGGHGTALPLSQNVISEGTATIDITPDAGYHIAGITDNGTPVTIANPYIINVIATHAVVVTFVAVRLDSASTFGIMAMMNKVGHQEYFLLMGKRMVPIERY